MDNLTPQAMEIYKYLRNNIDLEADRDENKINLINGVIHKFKFERKRAETWVDYFFANYTHKNGNEEIKGEHYSNKVGMKGELIDFEELFPKQKKERNYRMLCKHCKKELASADQKFCDGSCREAYINNVILFWKPDIVEEHTTGEKDVNTLKYEARLAFMNLVRDADPEELRLRIKVLKEVTQHAIEIAYSILDRDRLRAETEAELSLKGVSRKKTEERDKKLIATAETNRKIAEIKKAKEKIHPDVKKGAPTGHCRVCGVETLKETCSKEHAMEWKAIQHWMTVNNISEEKAREMVKLVREGVPTIKPQPQPEPVQVLETQEEEKTEGETIQ